VKRKEGKGRALKKPSKKGGNGKIKLNHKNVIKGE
jgi:hypothetical protein